MGRVAGYEACMHERHMLMIAVGLVLLTVLIWFFWQLA